FLDTGLRAKLTAARSNPPAGKAESDLLIELAPHVEDFLARLFGIEAEARALAERHYELAPLYSIKRLFVQRRAMHKVKPEDARPDGFTFTTELDFARQVTAWQQDEAANADKLEGAARYAAWAATTPEGKRRHRDGVLFKAPRKLDFMKLVPVHTETARGFAEHTVDHLRQRDGFKLTDAGTDLTGALDETNYCIWCHEQGKDSCSKGLREKAPRTEKVSRTEKAPLAEKAPAAGAAQFKKSPFGVVLAGCPLEEKISEFQKAKSEG